MIIVALVRRFAIVIAILVLALAWFVWPTPYRAYGPGGLMQINRFTGSICRVGDSCWR